MKPSTLVLWAGESLSCATYSRWVFARDFKTSILCTFEILQCGLGKAYYDWNWGTTDIQQHPLNLDSLPFLCKTRDLDPCCRQSKRWRRQQSPSLPCPLLHSHLELRSLSLISHVQRPCCCPILAPSVMKREHVSVANRDKGVPQHATGSQEVGPSISCPDILKHLYEVGQC